MKYLYTLVILAVCILFLPANKILAQTGNTQTVEIDTGETHQTITGFGASLAYYEGWLTAHPNKAEIYNIIFKELSLDILRVRNAYAYDPTMIDRVKEFAQAAKKSLGHPIDILSTSWSPAAYVKSNNDQSNGGTIKYTVTDGKVEFDYQSFANWWNESLDEYNANGVYPKYISIQNEPDWSASYESCLLTPSETVTSTDTIAGYNKALDAVYNLVTRRDSVPKLVGPGCVGIGYNDVENYINPLNLSELYAIAHHLYHGAEGGTVPDDPFTSTHYKEVGDFHPEVPHFQTEYSRGNWFQVAGMMFQSLAVENVTAYLYWDLIWVNGGGLVSLDFPWDRSQWTNSKGYTRTKDFYVFKHYSAFIQPGWKRIGASTGDSELKSAAFINTSSDSLTVIVINHSTTDSSKVRLDIPGFKIEGATAYTTTEDVNFSTTDYMADTVLTVPPKSINTVSVLLSKELTGSDIIHRNTDSYLHVTNYPNPFSDQTTLSFTMDQPSDLTFTVFDGQGRMVINKDLGFYPSGQNRYIIRRNGLNSGLYFYRLQNRFGKSGIGRFLIKD